MNKLLMWTCGIACVSSAVKAVLVGMGIACPSTFSIVSDKAFLALFFGLFAWGFHRNMRDV